MTTNQPFDFGSSTFVTSTTTDDPFTFGPETSDDPFTSISETSSADSALSTELISAASTFGTDASTVNAYDPSYVTCWTVDPTNINTFSDGDFTLAAATSSVCSYLTPYPTQYYGYSSAGPVITTGAAVGIGFAGLFFLILVGLGVWFILRRKRAALVKRTHESRDEPTTEHGQELSGSSTDSVNKLPVVVHEKEAEVNTKEIAVTSKDEKNERDVKVTPKDEKTREGKRLKRFTTRQTLPPTYDQVMRE